MNVKEKRKALELYCGSIDSEQCLTEYCLLGDGKCGGPNFENAPDEQIETWYAKVFSVQPVIKDSGERRASRTCVIRDNINYADLLGQLAEEAAELCHAALKLERVIIGTNPTPVTRMEATQKLFEETADVLNCLEVLQIWPDASRIEGLREEKLDRWVERIKERRETK